MDPGRGDLDGPRGAPPAGVLRRAQARGAGRSAALQVQNRGTIVGNLCNASPAADGVPNLLALDAVVELASVRGTRRVPVAAFVTGNRATVRAADELVTGLFVPDPAAGGRGRRRRSTFLKLGARAYLVISIAMVAAVLVRDADGRITSARVAVGACSAVAQRLAALEAELAGRPLAPGIGGIVRPDHLAVLTPDRRRPGDRRVPSRGGRGPRPSGARGARVVTAWINLSVNGAPVEVEVDPMRRLADVLRDDLGLTGTKIGCDAGDCGACTVRLDGRQVCRLPGAGRAGGRRRGPDGRGPGPVAGRGEGRDAAP